MLDVHRQRFARIESRFQTPSSLIFQDTATGVESCSQRAVCATTKHPAIYYQVRYESHMHIACDVPPAHDTPAYKYGSDSPGSQTDIFRLSSTPAVGRRWIFICFDIETRYGVRAIIMYAQPLGRNLHSLTNGGDHSDTRNANMLAATAHHQARQGHVRSEEPQMACKLVG